MLIGTCTGLSAQQAGNETSISVQVCLRAEYRNGALYPRYEGEEAAGFINNRARLSLDYKRNDLSMKVAAQHVGVWGQDPREVDFLFNRDIMKDVKLTGGYSVMFGSESMDIVKGGNHKSWQDWGWVSLNVNPSVFFCYI